jgi:Protein of unknown function (DUF3303)
MKFIVHWQFAPDAYQPMVARFLDSGGLPPKGIELLGRWHGMSGRGFAIVSTSDDRALFTWRAQWSDLLHLEIAPCLEDAEAGAVLAAMRG